MNERERNKAHVKMLIEAAMSEACAEYNPRLEKAFATLVSFRNHIETVVENHGGWQPGILQAVFDNLEFDVVAASLDDEFTEELLRSLTKMCEASLEKGIGQQAVFEALDEYAEEERQAIEHEHGVRLE